MCKVRLSLDEVKNLKNSLENIDQNGSIYIFGSRADLNKKGGDIDILIVSEKAERRDIRKIRREFFDQFGEQKLDIVLEKSLETLSHFGKEIIEKAVKL